MPTKTLYAFTGDLRGDASFTSEPSSTESFSYDLVNLPGIEILDVNRADDEMTFPLDFVFDSAQAQDQIDQQLGSDARRVGDIRAGWIPYAEVPYAGANPGRHPGNHLLATMEFDFHIDTPVLCVDIDGHVDYYVDFSLDSSGALVAFVDGWSYEFGGGTGILGDGCGRNQASGALDSGVPAGVSALQSGLGTWVQAVGVLTAPVVNGRARFRDVYLLPADGADGSGTTNTGDHVALALLPWQQWRFVDVVARLDRSLVALGATVHQSHVPHGMALSCSVDVDGESMPVLVHVGTVAAPVRTSGAVERQEPADDATSLGRPARTSEAPRVRRAAGHGATKG